MHCKFAAPCNIVGNSCLWQHKKTLPVNSFLCFGALFLENKLHNWSCWVWIPSLQVPYIQFVPEIICKVCENPVFYITQCNCIFLVEGRAMGSPHLDVCGHWKTLWYMNSIIVNVSQPNAFFANAWAIKLANTSLAANEEE